MNIDRLTKLAEWLESGAPHVADTITGIPVTGFDYRVGLASAGDCGTVCCIAGAAAQFWGEPAEDHLAEWVEALQGPLPGPREAQFFGPGGIGQEASLVLGLDDDTAEGLFHDGEWDEPDPQHAARVIRHLIATGTVDWSI